MKASQLIDHILVETESLKYDPEVTLVCRGGEHLPIGAVSGKESRLRGVEKDHPDGHVWIYHKDPKDNSVWQDE